MILKINLSEIVITLEWKDYKSLFSGSRSLEVPYYQSKNFCFFVFKDEEVKPSDIYTAESNFIIHLSESEIPRRANIFPEVIHLPKNKEGFQSLSFRCPFDISYKDIKKMCDTDEKIKIIKPPLNKRSYFVT